jgi:hypothetical protein
VDTDAVLQAVGGWAARPNRFVAGRGDQPQPPDYIRAFDAAMDELIAHAGAAAEPPVLGLALAFGSTERGEEASFRRVLKKYTRSVVFTDQNIHLLLVKDDGFVWEIPPEQVNAFLANLNQYIAQRKEDFRDEAE